MKLRNFLSLCLIALLTSCGSKDDRSEIIRVKLDEAYSALNTGDYAEAVEMCDELIQSDDASLMTWKDNCRAAEIYAAAYDNDYETDASMASAAKCLERAKKQHPDSVDIYINMLSHEYSGALNTVMQTINGLKTDRSTFGDHEEGDFYDSDAHFENDSI